MVKPKFGISKRDRLYITPKWVSNGHWAMRRDFIPHAMSLGRKQVRPLLPLLLWKEGRYDESGYIDDKVPDVDRVIPSRDGYSKITLSSEALVDRDKYLIYAMVFKNSLGDRFAVNPNYTPLMQAAEKIEGKTNMHPILLIDANDEVIGSVMPIRLPKEEA